MIGIAQKEYEENKTPFKKNDYINRLTTLKEQYEFLKDVYSHSLQQTVIDLSKGYSNFFKNPKHFGPPSFKKKNHKESFRVSKDFHVNEKLNRIRIPKLKSWILVRGIGNLQGQIRSFTISKKNGKYYVSILCIVEINELPKTGKAVGIDLGIRKLAVCSDGTEIENIKAFANLRSN